MAFNLKGRHLLTLKDYSMQEIEFLLNLSIKLKQDKYAGIRAKSLEGKNIALIFEKASTRTRCAFAYGVRCKWGTSVGEWYPGR